MSMVKLTKDELWYMNAFHASTGVLARDCIIRDDAIVFVVKEDSIGKAIGKDGRNVKSLSKRANKKIHVFAYAENVDAFIRQAFKDNKLTAIESQNKEVIVSTDYSEKKKILQNKWKFNIVKEMVKRNYDMDSLRIK
jgi:transcription termination/antitermination protein NusA